MAIYDEMMLAIILNDDFPLHKLLVITMFDLEV
jgi:hypothetical protein